MQPAAQVGRTARKLEACSSHQPGLASVLHAASSRGPRMNNHSSTPPAPDQPSQRSTGPATVRAGRRPVCFVTGANPSARAA